MFELVCKVNMITTAITKGKTVQIFKQHENLTLARNSARYVGIGKTIYLKVSNHEVLFNIFMLE